MEFITASKEQIILHMDELIKIEKGSLLFPRWDENNFLIDLDYKWMLSKIMYYNEILVGFAILSKKTEVSSHIHRFVIGQPFRGKGVGKIFLNHLKIEIAKKFEYLTLCVDSNNKEAIEFYKNNFFKPIFIVGNNTLMIFKNEFR
jgi:ribosomal protein S18 acetylase RimI-like enzyme